MSMFSKKVVQLLTSERGDVYRSFSYQWAACLRTRSDRGDGTAVGAKGKSVVRLGTMALGRAFGAVLSLLV